MVALDAGSALAVHTLFEMGGVFTGMRLYAINMQTHALGPVGRGSGYAVALGCVVGAIAGSKLAVWIDRPDLALSLAASPRLWLMGQSIVGALVGGLCGVEIAKRWSGVRVSTGDAFVVPLAAGIVIGRIGCFLAGLHDDTFGNPTTLPWGVDFGDGIARHPTQVYDMLFVAALALVLRSARSRLAEVPGLAFKLFFCGYLAWRFAIDFAKPVHDPYSGGLSGLQIIAAAALLAYLPFVVRALRRLR